MPKTDAQKLASKKYYASEKGKAKIKEYQSGRKEEMKIADKKYIDNNKEKISERKKKWSQTPSGIKSWRISKWKCQGIIDADLSAVYDYMLNETHCMICLKEYKNSQDRQLDHEHSITDDDNIRYICCHRCNTSIVC